MWFVYVIQNIVSDRVYIGITNDLKRRLKEHNSKGSRSYTQKYRQMWRLIYFEGYRSKKDAVDREKKLKQHGSSKKNLYKRIKNSFYDAKSEAGLRVPQE